MGPAGAWPYNWPCAQQYVGKSQSCMVISGRFIVHAPVGDDEEMVKGMEDGDVFKELETFFGAADKVVVKPKEEKKKGPQIVTLLDGKRANNISIMLAQFRISFLDIKVCARIQTVGTTSVMHGF